MFFRPANPAFVLGNRGVAVRAGDRRQLEDGCWEVAYEVTWQE